MLSKSNLYLNLYGSSQTDFVTCYIYIYYVGSGSTLLLYFIFYGKKKVCDDFYLNFFKLYESVSLDFLLVNLIDVIPLLFYFYIEKKEQKKKILF